MNKIHFSFSGCLGWDMTIAEQTQGLKDFVKRVTPLIEGKPLQKILVSNVDVYRKTYKSPSEMDILEKRLLPYSISDSVSRLVMFIIDDNNIAFGITDDDDIAFDFNETKSSIINLNETSPSMLEEYKQEHNDEYWYDISYGFQDIIGTNLEDISLLYETITDYDNEDVEGVIGIEFTFSNGMKFGMSFTEDVEKWIKMTENT